jgi:hypothetical protein
MNLNAVEFVRAMHPDVSVAIANILNTAYYKYFLNTPERMIFKYGRTHGTQDKTSENLGLRFAHRNFNKNFI